jgi:hypothetical protein
MRITENVERITGRLYRNGTACLVIPPRHRNNYIQPKQTAIRKFTVKRKEIESSCLVAWSKRKSKFMLFITFTFPYNPSEDQARKTWKLMLDSFRNTYKINNYVWVKENQQSGRIHYHVIVDRNRIDIKLLQQTWCTHIDNIIRGVTHFDNSVRLGFNPIIRNPLSIKKYLSKYISKTQKSVDFNKRAWGTTAKKTELYKKIDVSYLIEHYFEPKNSGYVSLSYVAGIKIIAETDCYIVFSIQNYADISPPT